MTTAGESLFPDDPEMAEYADDLFQEMIEEGKIKAIQQQLEENELYRSMSPRDQAFVRSMFEEW